jgi:hypothetical protein
MEAITEPFAWTYIGEEGVRRQIKVHYTRDGDAVVWDPRAVGDPKPWFDANYDENDPDARYEDADLVTLGMPVTSWSSFDL